MIFESENECSLDRESANEIAINRSNAANQIRC
jgi:hypothetical protein